MIPKHTPFMLPWQFDQLSVNHFEVRDAGGHLICRLTTDDAVVETLTLVRMLTAAPQLREAIMNLLDELNGRDDIVYPSVIRGSRALIATIDADD